MSGPYAIRPARRQDLPFLAAIERAALALFARVGMPELLQAPVLDLSDVERYHAQGFVAAAEHVRDGVVGFVVVRPLGGCAHVQEMDVHPDHGRQGLGRGLLETALDWARGAGYPAATLSTFRDIPWNAPFYERFGFRELALADATAELLDLRRAEAAEGLPIARRILMRLDL